MRDADLIAVGEIIKCHGIRGEVKVMPLTDDPARFGKLGRVFLKNSLGIQELHLEGYRLLAPFVLVKFEGVDDLSAAEALGRGLICILRRERMKLPEGRYYHDQLEGLRVYTLSGQLLGEIERILETGANDVYVVAGGGREILIPALKQVVRKIDLAEGKIIVTLPEGLNEDV